MLDGGKGSSGGKGDSGGKGVNRFEPYDYGKGKGKGKGKDKGKDKGMNAGKGKSKGTGKGGTAEGQVCLYQCTGYTLAPYHSRCAAVSRRWLALLAPHWSRATSSRRGQSMRCSTRALPTGVASTTSTCQPAGTSLATW
tara:strand:+ start:171 stop:587 length:417 start_codon:yes stop_codon:yes gene_type:complete